MKQIPLNLLVVLAASLALNSQISTANAQSTDSTLLITFTNPTPVIGGYFGSRVAAIGNDRVLIGSMHNDTGVTNAGAAYLFNTNGVFLTTFANPTPTAYDSFGDSIAAVGTDRILIGASGDNTDIGAAYLFNTNGTLITTFLNPTPSVRDYFGSSVAAVGDSEVLIGANGDDMGVTDAGAAYLFSTNGTLLTTFTNPTPADGDNFGVSVGAIGVDRIIIGASPDDTGATDAGAAYLFSTNGTLLTTFTNPTPAVGDYFGSFVAAVGSNRILIGAIGDDTGAINAGAAYLFSTNGALLTTFTNPTPADYDNFGQSMSASLTDRIVIGAHRDDTGAVDAGAAYVFSTNGALITTITNPAPVEYDWFGYSVASVGNGWVLIGALGDNAGVTDSGTAYLFSLTASTPPAPSLTIRLTSANAVTVSWPSPSSGWTLQETTNGSASVNWINALGIIQDDGANKALVISPVAGNRFYRLFKP